MGRYRPPRAKGSPYITPEGEAALRAELQALWKEERPVVTAAVQAAAGNGDRSENGDYIYGKKRLREIDSRVRFLRKRLEELTVVRDPPSDRGKAYFGAWVDLENPDGERVTWRVVGPDEFDLQAGKLSCDSPLGRALLGKPIDSEITIDSPSGDQYWYLLDVRYQPPA
ncbi:transcription elongation factor GreB [Luminiphilus syltensis NOR5-1B]|uniref:Transcription elongation factor GreB n=1 Tax=Luminiphilus syltensis NOR5-1B TaxID=565045 RepID=B8KY75_9GAMM|nr:transcription elongation factor GreB [Luminiphilus syltensis]EED35987.1 transcription elongation factor GreB [Luminiphilus syltensis NOR5-1B]